MITSSYPWWWLALPLLLLPIWWHRRKRQRVDATPLATARFLPTAAPEQLRVWQWRDRLLLLLRCLLLLALIAWLAATVFPWRGDTVLADAGADQAWVTRQIADAGMSDARRIDLPPVALVWLRQNEREWRADARLLIVAREGQIGMAARAPQFDHAVELRVQAAPVPPVATAASKASSAPATEAATAATAALATPAADSPAADPPAADPPAAIPGTSATTEAAAPATIAAPAVVHRNALSATPEREQAWRALFAAFERAGEGTQRYAMSTAPAATTEMIVWDTPALAPPADWRAPHWWLGTGSEKTWSMLANANFKAKATTIIINGVTLRYADSARGRLWTSTAFPPQDAGTARALFEAWRLLATAPSPAYPAPSHKFSIASAVADARPVHWIVLLVLALFFLERSLTHARRS